MFNKHCLVIKPNIIGERAFVKFFFEYLLIQKWPVAQNLF